VVIVLSVVYPYAGLVGRMRMTSFIIVTIVVVLVYKTEEKLHLSYEITCNLCYKYIYEVFVHFFLNIVLFL
jgi:hypothetical protein